MIAKITGCCGTVYIWIVNSWIFQSCYQPHIFSTLGNND